MPDQPEPEEVVIPDGVYYAFLGIVDLKGPALVLRTFETLAETETYRESVAVFYSEPQAIKTKPLGDVIKMAKKSKKPMRVVFSRYDGAGQLVDVETLFDPYEPLH